MRANNTTSPTFGTNLAIGASQQGRLEKLSKNFLDGIILTGADITRNGISDELVLGVNRAKPTKANPKGIFNQLALTWFSPDGKDIKEKNIWLKAFENKTPVQVKKFLIETLSKFQPKELKAKAKAPEEKLNSKNIIKHAHLSVQLAPERIEAAQQGRKISKQAEKAFYLVKKYGVDDFTCA